MSEQQIETAVEGPPAEVSEAMDYDAELSRLESEYVASHPAEEQPQDAAQPPEPDAPPSVFDLVERQAEYRRQIDEMAAEHQHWRMKEFVENYEKTISETMGAVKNLGPINMSDAALRRHLIGFVNNDPAGKAAYDNRADDPVTWRNYASGMASEIHREFGKQALTETSDIEAVEASVRGQQTMEPYRRRIDTSQVGNMNPQQYAEWKRENT